MRFRDRLANFMNGRYGVDKFNRFLMIVSFATMLIAFITGLIPVFPVRIVSWVFWGLTIALIAYEYFRMFSKNISARVKESYWYERMYNKVRGIFKVRPDHKTHKIFRCPNCAQKIRVPRNKGKICIKCPKCRIEFIKKT